MNIKRKIFVITGLILAILITGCSAPGNESSADIQDPAMEVTDVFDGEDRTISPNTEVPATQGALPDTGAVYPNGQLLVDTAWLSDHLDDPDLRIIDMRDPGEYTQEHIPGAVNLPVNDIVGTINNIPFEFDPAGVQTSLNNAGLTPEMTVVIYDNLGMMNAARMFWTLEYAGHTDVKILNGGWNAWVESGQEVSDEAPPIDPSQYPVEPDNTKLVTAEEVVERLDDPGVVIVDARSPQEYNGEVLLAERGGHIPGAVNLVWLDALEGGDTVYTIESNWEEELHDEDVEVFKGASELQEIIDGLEINRDQQVITYCQTLWRGAHAYFLFRLMGFEDVRGYDGSWVEWGNNPDYPVEQ